MHEMQTIVIDDSGHLSVCITWLCCANTAERIEVLLGVETLDPRNIVSAGSPDFCHRFNVAFDRILCPVVSLG